MKDIEQVKFELTEAITWGVERNRNGGFSIPVSINDDEVKSKIEDLVKKYNTKNPLYGRSKTLYLKSKRLSVKQEKNLLDKGRSFIKVCFTTKCLYTRDVVNYIVFEVTKLSKVDKYEDSCPQD